MHFDLFFTEIMHEFLILPLESFELGCVDVDLGAVDIIVRGLLLYFLRLKLNCLLQLENFIP
jgi:hypothetical protein